MIVLLLAALHPAAAQERDRSKIEDKYKWNLADIYPSDAAWREAKNRMAATGPAGSLSIGALAKYKGTLSASPQQLLIAWSWSQISTKSLRGSIPMPA